MMLIALVTSLYVQALSNGHVFFLQDILQAKMKLTNFILLFILTLVYHFALTSMNLYDSKRLLVGKGEWKDVSKAVVMGILLLLCLAVIFQRGHVSKSTLLMW